MFLTDADTRYKFILIFSTEIQFFMRRQQEPEAIKVALPSFSIPFPLPIFHTNLLRVYALYPYGSRNI